MEKEEKKYQEHIAGNILKILSSKNLKQSAIAPLAFSEPTAMSKILSCQRRLSVGELANIAKVIGVTPVDILTWPAQYVPVEKGEEPAEVFLQLRLTKEKKDQVLKLVFGENNIEILNR